MPSLFAGKLSAVLLRHWKGRIKGRDFYDYLFYVGRGTEINMAFLSANLRKEGVIDGEVTLEELKKMLEAKFLSIDFKEAAKEVSSFLLRPNDTDCWDAKYFLNTLDRLTIG